MKTSCCRILVFGLVWLIAAPLLAQSPAVSTSRAVRDFDFDWRFSRGDFPTACLPEFDDADWRTLDLPHDWSIEGPFGPEYASGTGYAPGGIAWYRKHFHLDNDLQNRQIAVEFDGVYQNAEIWINGHFIARRPCGYISFQCDLTPHLKFGAAANVLAVRVDHTRFADSRWYTGSGIYRRVRLRITDKLRIKHWGTFITTPDVNPASALIHVETAVANSYQTDRQAALQLSILNPDGQEIARMSDDFTLADHSDIKLSQQIRIPNPQRWSPDSPALYTLQSRLIDDSRLIDETATPFGIRTFRFDPDDGFFLNGQNMLIKGLCLHHDAGCLGAAVPARVLERRLRILKELGCNAIRTSHNPPAPELLDLCDRLGFLVQDEAFDEFTPGKNKWVQGRNVGHPSRFGYAEYFREWAVRDIRDMVRRDRNHPSIIMWSIGNEIDYANDPFSHPVLGDNYRKDHPRAENLVSLGRPLVETVKTLDTTRPVTAALANMPVSNAVGFADMLDIVGYNYQEKYYRQDHEQYPKRVIYGSENGDSYDAWLAVRDNDFIAAQFLWTGIDYLGEAGEWPRRAAGAGIVDMAGFVKPVGRWRQSLWSERPMVYLCTVDRARNRYNRLREHWNYADGDQVTLLACTNCDELRLELNGRTIGVKNATDRREGWLRWRIPWQPGRLTAVGLSYGKNVCTFSLNTAADAAQIRLRPDRKTLRPDGKDICHLEFRVTDRNGVRIPHADHEITFELSGPADIIGIENGDLFGNVDYQDNQHRARFGRGLAILQARRQTGPVTITASAPALKSQTVTIKVQ